MKRELLDILEQLDRWMEDENRRRRNENDLVLSKVLIQILGQCSLILHPNVKKLTLFGTRDLDAHIQATQMGAGVSEVRRKLTQLLQDQGLELEFDDHLIWLPKETTFTQIMNTMQIQCEVVDPVYALCSKAIKAKEKNKILIHEALNQYGEELGNLIVKYGGELDYFE